MKLEVATNRPWINPFLGYKLWFYSRYGCADLISRSLFYLNIFPIWHKMLYGYTWLCTTLHLLLCFDICTSKKSETCINPSRSSKMLLKSPSHEGNILCNSSYGFSYTYKIYYFMHWRRFKEVTRFKAETCDNPSLVCKYITKIFFFLDRHGIKHHFS